MPRAYEPWTERWYTDSSIRCVFPELGPLVGHAVTCVYGLPDPDEPDRYTFLDVVDALDAAPKPTVLVIEQRWPPELRAKAGLAGEIMTTQMQQVGCVGLITDGPSRDVDAIRRLGFQLLLNGVSAVHAQWPCTLSTSRCRWAGWMSSPASWCTWTRTVP